MASLNASDVGFELGEDRPANLEARKRQESKWSEARVDARQHFSAREAVKEHQGELQQAMCDYQVVECMVSGLYQKQCPLSQLKEIIVRLVLGFALWCTGGELLFDSVCARRQIHHPYSLSKSRPFVIHARVRPMTPAETVGPAAVKPVSGVIQAKRLCAVSRAVAGSTNLQSLGDTTIEEPVGARQSFVLCHDGRLSRSGRRLTMHHRCFLVDKVWGADETNPSVCGAVVLPLMKRAAQGKRSTVVLYGQTGTGKTHTLHGCLNEISRELACQKRNVELTFTEVQGKKCFDLLNNRKELRLLSDALGSVHARGATQLRVACSDPAELVRVVEPALVLRSSLETERNKNSSRSHAVCTIYFPADSEGSSLGCGKVSLVDLAGSEQRWETMTMSGKDHRESANIHMALSTLKQCFRMYHDHLRNSSVRSKAPAYPYRNSALTRMLRDSFVDGSDHRTVVMACVSPSSGDMLHTLNTLENVVLMSPMLDRLQSSTTVEVPMVGSFVMDTPVHEWTHGQVTEWVAQVQGGKFAHVVLPPNIDGWGLLNLSQVTLADLFQAETRTARAADEGQAWTVGLHDSGANGRLATALSTPPLLLAASAAPAAAHISTTAASGTLEPLASTTASGGGVSAEEDPNSPRRYQQADAGEPEDHARSCLSSSSRAYYEALGRELYLALRKEQQDVNGRLLDEARRT